MLKRLHTEIKGALEALRSVRRAANVRVPLLTLSPAAIASGVALLVAFWVLPTPAETATLRPERDPHCDPHSTQAREQICVGAECLCVRVDLKAPRYGDSSDYLSSGALAPVLRYL